MAIIIRKSTESPDIGPLYTSSLQKLQLVVGLGNPGQKYVNNYHNLGFMCLDAFSRIYQLDWLAKPNFESHLAQIDLAGSRLLLLKPQTYVNLSGRAVLKAVQFYKLDPGQIYVVHDEIRHRFQTVETLTSQQDFGHNGLKSIFQTLKPKQLNLVRVGIGPQPERMDLSDFVLSNLKDEQQERLPAITKEVCSIIGEIDGGNFKNEKRVLT